jgi:hypothetical protein
MNLNNLSNPQIAVIAVARLGGDVRTIDSEDIAVIAYNIAPKRFCWRKYPDKIDIATVRFALSDAAKPNLALLLGSNKEGWMLSPGGVKWVSSLPTEFEADDESNGTKRGSILAAQEAERARLHRTAAFAKFQLGDSKVISLIDFREFVRINEYFPERQRRERLAAIENAVLNDPALESLWQFMKKKFRKEMASNERKH